MQYIYIDESGSITNSPHKRYFVIGFIITEDSNAFQRSLKIARRDALKEIKRNKDKYQFLFDENNKLKELKGSNTANRIKEIYVKQVNKNCEIDYVAIICDNKNVTHGFMEDKNRSFNYLVKTVVKYLVKANLLKANEDIKFLIDNRNVKTKAKAELEGYLISEYISGESLFNSITVEYVESTKNYYVQFVDIFANAVYKKENRHNNSVYDIFVKHNSIIKILRHPYK